MAPTVLPVKESQEEKSLDDLRAEIFRELPKMVSHSSGCQTGDQRGSFNSKLLEYFIRNEIYSKK
jgi:hypothetical protein